LLGYDVVINGMKGKLNLEITPGQIGKNQTNSKGELMKRVLSERVAGLKPSGIVCFLKSQQL
jgi:hypothetical protein